MMILLKLIANHFNQFLFFKDHKKHQFLNGRALFKINKPNYNSKPMERNMNTHSESRVYLHTLNIVLEIKAELFS